MKRFLITSGGSGDATVKAGTISGVSDRQGQNEDPGDTASVTTPSPSGPSVAKVRKYDDSYLSLGFTRTIINGQERPQCVICLAVLASDSMKPNKLKRHLDTKHGNIANEPRAFFQRKLNSFKSTKSSFSKIASVPSKALLASYQVSHRIAQKKKPHTIGEELILPAAIDMVSTMLGESMGQQLKAIPMSNDTVSRRIADISEDLHAQLIEKVKNSHFAIQVDEATDLHRDAHLICYIRFVDGEAMREELLFCETFSADTTGESIFRIIDTFLKDNDISWIKCAGICTDGARAMSGKYTGLRGLIKKVAPEARWTHCIIHREALAAKGMTPELDEVLHVVVKTVNLIKGQPLKSRVFKILCEDMGSEHTVLLFHTEARWLSRGKALTRIFELRHEVLALLLDENHQNSTFFTDSDFLLRLAYMADIFEKINALNKSLQKKDANLMQWNEKVKSFVKKLNLYKGGLKSDNLELFPNLKIMIEEMDLKTIPTNGKICFLKHLEILKSRFEKYFDENLDGLAWIQNPFKPSVDECSLNMMEKENLIDLQGDTGLEMKFKESSLTSFWIGVQKEHPILSEKALKILTPFATTYSCETGFSALAAMKSKYRSRLNVTKELRVALSELTPRFNKLCAEKKQSHPSH